MEFKKLNFLVQRNIKLYFKDKMMFFCSLITPLILIVLFLTFLGSTYKESLLMCLPEGVQLSDKIINGFTGGWLFSSILATSCITVAFCSNMIVMDKVNKVTQDFVIAPVRKTTLQVSYVISNFVTTLLICSIAIVIGFVYLSIAGWWLRFVDVLFIFGTTILATLFGVLLSSLIWLFVSSQGGVSAICTLISSMYGFLCGAYMPIGGMSPIIQKLVGFLPGTYATVLFRQGYMNGVLDEIAKTQGPEVVEKIRESFDGTFFFFNHEVPTWAMFLIVAASIVLLFGVFVLCVCLKDKKRKPKYEKKEA